MISLHEAIELISSEAHSFGNETVSIQHALGRVLAEEILADRNYPPFNRVAMDGIAICYSDFENGIRDFLITETIYAGSAPQKTFEAQGCYRIMTGAALPNRVDTVIKIEDVKIHNGIASVHLETIKQGQHIAKEGEDVHVGDIILQAGTYCSPQVISALAVVGKEEIQVARLPRIAIITTGNEVIPMDHEVTPLHIRNSNGYALTAMCAQLGVKDVFKLHAADDVEMLTRIISEVLHYDIVVLSGGVSAGEADYVPKVLESLGVKTIFHKVAIKPGKPVLFGITPHDTAVFALPGNPMSCQITFKLFVELYLKKGLGLTPQSSMFLPINTTRKKKSPLSELFPCTMQHQPHTCLQSNPFNGSGDVTSTLYSDGIALHPHDKEILDAGTLVEFFAW